MRAFLYPQENFSEKPNLDKLDGRCWIRVDSPTPEDIHFLVDELGVPESFLSDIADTDERPRTEEEEGWLLTILRIPLELPNQEGPSYSTVPVGVISKSHGGVIITVCYHETRVIPDFIEYVRRKHIETRTHPDFILRFIYSSAVWFLKYLKQINVEVTQAEKELRRSISNEDLLLLMKLQKCLVYFNTSIRGNETMIGRLRTTYGGEMDEDLAEDVVIEMRQASNMVNIYSDILTGTMDAFASIISNNVNTIMKRMTSISIVLMVPTLIASFYGMNVDVYIGRQPHSFIAIVGVSFILALMIFLLFKRIKWL